MYDTILDIDLQVGNELRRVFAETVILYCSSLLQKEFSAYSQCHKCGGIFDGFKVDKNKRKYVSCACTFYNPINSPPKKKPKLVIVGRKNQIQCACCGKALLNKHSILEHVCTDGCTRTIRQILGGKSYLTIFQSASLTANTSHQPLFTVNENFFLKRPKSTKWLISIPNPFKLVRIQLRFN